MSLGPLLSTISSPEDLKRLSQEELIKLCAEMRELIAAVISENGGHLATNLGTVEISTALHLAFDFKLDRLIFDVGHQCYAHKILTGRRDRFNTIRTTNGLSGYPNPDESEYDCFTSGHASTAISLATGYAQAFAHQGLDRRVVALIGDGSLTGGEAYEGLCYLGSTNLDVLVVLNDNRMAISPSIGGLTRYLNHMRTSPRYLGLKKDVQNIVKRLPVFSDQVNKLLENLHDSVSKMVVESGIFATLGYKYFGPYDGHDVNDLLIVLKEISKLRRPVLLHILTDKGKGDYKAESDPEKYHGVGPRCKDTITISEPLPAYTDVFADALVEIGARDEKVVALTAAMPTGTGVIKFMNAYPGRGIDVGIAEQHCVTMAAAMARGGMKPVVAIYSTFVQRAVDQYFHDVLLQKDLGVVFTLDRAGLVGEDGPTHHGLYDIAFLRPFPGSVMCSPAGAKELKDMLDWAISSGLTVAMRYPRTAIAEFPEIDEFPPVELGKGFVVRDGRDVAILAYGPTLRSALDAAYVLEKKGVDCRVVNMRFASPVDTELIQKATETKLVVTIEEHAEVGGFGSIVRESLSGTAEHLLIAVPNKFIPHGARAELLKMCGLDCASIAERIETELNR